ncbi:MAG: hypothetical protein DRN30_00755 [Thermoplasmata archaeon]|nr:MAG: hypothetical protein DRN30_00755 [Thermoplasmata archaeon]
MSEQTLLKQFLKEASKLGHRLFRNNTGTGWVGKATRCSSPRQVTLYPGDVLIRQARPLHAGLIKGSSDLIGWSVIRVTSEMVGQRVAIFTAAELKTGRLKATTEQQNFVNKINLDGGIAVVAYEFNELKKRWGEYE